jgi:hypothetical protein
MQGQGLELIVLLIIGTIVVLFFIAMFVITAITDKINNKYRTDKDKKRDISV